MGKSMEKDLFIFGFISTIVLLLGLYNMYLSHAVIETITIVISAMIFITAINSRDFLDRKILLSFGIAYLYVAIIDFGHFITFEGGGLLESTQNISNLYYVAARYLEVLVILISVILIGKIKKVRYNALHIMYAIITVVVIFIINSDFAPMFYENSEVTNLKIIVQIFLICLINTSIFMVLIFIDDNDFIKTSLILSLLFKLIAELLLFTYGGIELINLIGHIFRLFSYAFLYRIFVAESISNPYKLFNIMFTKKEEVMQKLIETDSLTGILNHSALFKQIEELINNYSDERKNIFVTMIDFDDFKLVNDKFGHQVGDEMLVKFSEVLGKIDYEHKIFGRYGGDEFVVAGVVEQDFDFEARYKLISDILAQIGNEKGVDMKFSAGVALYSKGDTVKDMIYKADIKMYESKKRGKNCITIWKDE